MNRDKRLLCITTVAMVWVMALGGPASAGTPTNTNWLGASSPEKGVIDGVVGVCEKDQQECGRIDGTMRVKLFKRIDGAWVKIAAKRAARESEGLWSATFTGAPRRGKCKLVAIYSGSDTFDRSRDAITGGCGTNANWAW